MYLIMDVNNIERISKCFEDKQMVRDIINAFLEDGLDDIRSIITGLHHYNLDDQTKKELVIFYINNKSKDGIVNNHLRELMCDPSIRARFNYQDFKKLLCYYVYDNSTYDLIKSDKYPESIMRDVEDRIVNGLVSSEKLYHIEKKPGNRNAYQRLLYIITKNPNIFKYRTKDEIRKLIYFGLSDTGGVLRSVIVNDNILKYRNMSQQKTLMERNMSKPYASVGSLITDEDILSKFSHKKQIELLDEYNANPNDKTLRDIITRAKKQDNRDVTTEDFMSGIPENR